MANTKPHFHNHEDTFGGDLRPYVFQRDGSDVVREAFTTLLEQRIVHTKTEQPSSVDAIILEQRQTMFEHDHTMREFFRGDFEAFCAALDAPWQFGDQLAKHNGQNASGFHPTHAMDDVLVHSRQWESQPVGDVDALPTLDDDPVYNHAFQWTCRVERWSRRMLAEQKSSEPAILRIAMNTPLVPVKIAYGFSASLDEDTNGFEVALVGYRQAAIFCMRALESLGMCYGKRIGAAKIVHEFLDEGRELLADIEATIAEIESELHFRRGHIKE